MQAHPIAVALSIVVQPHAKAPQPIQVIPFACGKRILPRSLHEGNKAGIRTPSIAVNQVDQPTCPLSIKDNLQATRQQISI